MRPSIREFLAATTAAVLFSSHAPLLAQSPPPASAAPAASPAPEAPAKLPPEQLDSLVAPIALYPDPLLAQTLVASTYPLEIIQLQQWLAKNSKLKDKELADAVAKQDWDPSIQSMAATPEVVKRLSDDIQWTTDLGNAFLAQQSDVMDACQRMRKKAKEKGALESNEQQKVEEKKEGEKTVIVVQPSNPEVIYVPSYSPTVVYGPPPYPYPPIYYPPYPPGAAFVSFSFGVMMGAAFWGGSCCGCGWGGNNVNINVNNNFNRNTNINRGGGGGRGGVGGVGGAGGVGGVGGAGGVGGVGGAGGGNWSHNPKHRGGAPYGDKGTANKFGGNARGDSLSSRQNKAGGSPSAGNRASGPSASNRASGGAGGGAGSRPSASTGARGGGGGGDKVGNRSVGSSSSRQSGFGGGSGGFSGSSARSSGSRGASSFGGSRGGGGGSRGGGGGRRR